MHFLPKSAKPTSEANRLPALGCSVNPSECYRAHNAPSLVSTQSSLIHSTSSNPIFLRFTSVLSLHTRLLSSGHSYACYVPIHLIILYLTVLILFKVYEPWSSFQQPPAATSPMGPNNFLSIPSRRTTYDVRLILFESRKNQ